MPATCHLSASGGHREAPRAASGRDVGDPDLQFLGMDPSQHSTGSYLDTGGQCWDWELCSHPQHCEVLGTEYPDW